LFKARNTLEGVTLESFDANAQAIYKKTIEDTIGEGARIEDFIVRVDDGTDDDNWKKLTDDELKDAQNVRRLQGILDITYTIEIILGDGNSFSNDEAGAAYDLAKVTLTVSLENGVFANNLHENLVSAESPIAETIVVPKQAPVVTEYTEVEIIAETDDGSVNGDSVEDSTGTIAGAVAGVVIVACIAGYFFSQYINKKKAMSNSVHTSKHGGNNAWGGETDNVFDNPIIAHLAKKRAFQANTDGKGPSSQPHMFDDSGGSSGGGGSGTTNPLHYPVKQHTGHLNDVSKQFPSAERSGTQMDPLNESGQMPTFINPMMFPEHGDEQFPSAERSESHVERAQMDPLNESGQMPTFINSMMFPEHGDDL